MPESKKPQQSQQRKRVGHRPKSDQKGPCREEQQGMTCSGNEPLDRQPEAKTPPAGKQRHDPEEQRPGSTEKAPGGE